MAYLTSADGTSIAYQRDGGGPAVVLVGMASMTAQQFDDA